MTVMNFLIDADILNDRTIVRIQKRLDAESVFQLARGNWYQDNILFWSDAEMTGYTVDFEENEITIYLK